MFSLLLVPGTADRHGIRLHQSGGGRIPLSKRNTVVSEVGFPSPQRQVSVKLPQHPTHGVSSDLYVNGRAAIEWYYPVVP